MNNKWKKICIGIAAGLGVAVLLYFAFFKFIPALSSPENEEAIESFLAGRSRLGGLICLALLQILQVVSIFFPGAPIQIAGGLVYGTLESFLVCHLSFLFANVAVFYLARRRISLLGRILARHDDKMKKVTDWLNSSDPAYMSALAYMLPGIPNGFVPYAAMHTNMRAKSFAVSVWLGSLLQIFIMCSVGSQIMNGNYLLSVLMIVGMLVLILILYLNKERVIRLLQARRDRREAAKKE